MQKPLVSIICLCYNHEYFIEEALESVFQQTYENIQIIIVDDASTDESVGQIQRIIRGRICEFIPLKKNLGNCAAFNKGFALAKGKYIIDFATDDILMPNRIERQVNFFKMLDESYGIVFTDAAYIDAKGKHLRNHYDYLFKKRLLKHVPQHEVYQDVLKTYFICSPTMMIKHSVLLRLGGYDENLSFEDFDFWVRSSRTHKYAFLNEILTKVRKVSNSLSTRCYKMGDTQLYATYLVCRKAQLLNRSSEEFSALSVRIRYELRHAVFSQNKVEAKLFYNFLEELKGVRPIDKIVYMLSKLNLPLSIMRRLYHVIRY